MDYEEFLAATVHMSKLNREELVMDAFKHFDKDGSGSITKEELNLALQEVWHGCVVVWYVCWFIVL